MPTLDDLPIIPTLSSLAADDFIPVSDTSASGAGSSKVRKLPISSILGLASGDITSSAAGTITISSRVLSITSGTTSTLTLPSASGSIREVIVINNGSGTATIGTLASGGGSTSILTTVSARFLSNGTGWYRVS
jgi:hypothetical protein